MLFGRQRFNLQIVFVRFCFSALRRRVSGSGAYLIPYQIDTVPSIFFIAEFIAEFRFLCRNSGFEPFIYC